MQKHYIETESKCKNQNIAHQSSSLFYLQKSKSIYATIALYNMETHVCQTTFNVSKLYRTVQSES